MVLRRIRDVFKLSIQSLQQQRRPGDRFEVVLADESIIPTSEHIVLPTWNRSYPLPSPSDVRSSKNFLLERWRSNVVHVKELGLVVKYGERVYPSEAHAMLFASTHSSVRTPTLYGWYHDSGETFIFSEFLEGETLEARWPSLDPLEKFEVVSQLRKMVHSMRRIAPDPKLSAYIGGLHKSTVQDYIFEDKGVSSGPFSTAADFYQAFYSIGRNLPGYPKSILFQNLHDSLPLNTRIVFTHGDLHRTNIMVAGSGPSVTISIIDWAQAGWRPEWWEILKARWCVGNWEEWGKEYIPLFLPDAHQKELEVVAAFDQTGILL